MHFSKYEGAGNDFILIDDRPLSFPVLDKQFIQLLCDRKFGIGADGVILLQPNFRMRIFNSDGSEAESCGNGIRCFVRFLGELGFVEDRYRIELKESVVFARLEGERVAVDMGEAKDLRLKLKTERGEVHFVDTGVPHMVQFVENVDGVDLSTIGPYLRRHPLFGSKGANVNVAEKRGDGSIHVRTFERGVEGETLACGTGAVAVACVTHELFGWPLPIRILFRGGTLEIGQRAGRWEMVGPARKVFSGTLTQ
jgi:diaminopimelate epimerase